MVFTLQREPCQRTEKACPQTWASRRGWHSDGMSVENSSRIIPGNFRNPGLALSCPYTEHTFQLRVPGLPGKIGELQNLPFLNEFGKCSRVVLLDAFRPGMRTLRGITIRCFCPERYDISQLTETTPSGRLVPNAANLSRYNDHKGWGYPFSELIVDISV